MEWIEHLNKAIDYIEIHLLDDIDYNQLGKITGCPAYNFQKIFSYISGFSISEYVQRRRLSLAAIDLQNSESKVIDIALKYGYTSPTAFNRAFQSLHGIAPSQVKECGIPLKSVLPISFKMTIKGVEEMNYRIEKKEEIRIIGIAQPLSKDIEENFKIVPQMWHKAGMDGTLYKLADMMNSHPMGILGVSVYKTKESLSYFIGVASTSQIDDTFEEYIIPASTWAVFSNEGTQESIQDLERRIWTEWFPSSGYEYVENVSDIEAYLNSDPQNAKYEVWVPVRKKA
ncbi:AraC family transcriptional regulator [Clostridioides sp. ZZV15-6598]|uniref:AraC family transcriptional regulator n=1 Tax=Clostridioides sp. ZZV15-6598 TaxID=2811501 RepID=UPI001D11B974|nr:AraC family transcriptional regulator [Clostridioides sp. ZZV15-6598]